MTAVKRALPVACALILLGFAIILIPPVLHVTPPVHGTSRTIALIGSAYYGWNYSQRSGTNPPITVVQGDSVTMLLSSGDSPTQHQFLVDVDGDGHACLGSDPCSPLFMSSTSISYPFTVNFALGTYRYYCTIHFTSMVGQFIVHGFTAAPNPTSLAIVQGSSGASTVTLTSVNGFAGNVVLSNSAPSGITASFNPTSVPLASGGSQTSQATISVANTVPVGTYTATLSGTSGSATGSTTVMITVSAPATPDFSLTPNPSSITVNPGITGSSTIAIASLNGFSGTLNLAGKVSPSGPSVSFSPASVTLSSGGSATSSMAVSTVTGYYNTPVGSGNYSVNVTATNGTLTRSIIVPLTISSSTPSGAASLPLTIIAGVAAVIIAAVAIAVYVVRRRTPIK